MTKHAEFELHLSQVQAHERDIKPLDEKQIHDYLEHFEEWTYLDGKIEKTFVFQNYYQTTAFVNAVVWIAHCEDHHPGIEFGYKTCRVAFHTHSIHGISENDFIAAAKVDALITD